MIIFDVDGGIKKLVRTILFIGVALLLCDEHWFYEITKKNKRE